MNTENVQRRIFHLLADILEYPRSDLTQAARECAALLSLGNPEAAAGLREFQDFLAETPLGRQQEVYTATFDLDATCHLYVGHHLFGESYKRSAFMLGLKERYEKYNLALGSEVADHLAVIVHFLSLCDEADQATVIIQEALLPALARMVKQDSEKDESPSKTESRRERGYQAVLQALQQFLTNDPGRTTKEGPLVGGRSSLVGS